MGYDIECNGILLAKAINFVFLVKSVFMEYYNIIAYVNCIVPLRQWAIC